MISIYLILLTQMPFGPNSSAKHLLNISKALLAVQYIIIWGLFLVVFKTNFDFSIKYQIIDKKL
jgi:hypothetical protein